jgi:hypothetical protein
VHVTDLFATVLELAGLSLTTALPPGHVLDGQSLVPLLQQAGTWSRNRIYSEGFDASNAAYGGRMLRDERYKLLRLRTGQDLFYDLQSDPYGTTDLLASAEPLSADEEARLLRLRFELGRYVDGAPPVPRDARLDGAGFTLTVPWQSAAEQSLWRCEDLSEGFWTPVPSALRLVNGTDLTLTDPAPPPLRAHYSVLSELP